MTQLGISQATHAHNAWKEELAFQIPLPDKMYCSPLTRAIRTHEIIFRGIVPESERSARKTVVVEVWCTILTRPNNFIPFSSAASTMEFTHVTNAGVAHTSRRHSPGLR